MKRIFLIAMVMALLFGLAPIGSLPVAAASADLMVTGFTWNNETEVQPDTPIIFCVTVKNDGGTAVTEPFEVTFGTPTTTFSTVSCTESIAPGKSVVVQSQVWTAVKGDYMVAVRVDPANTVTEIDETNNTRQANLRVAEDEYTSAYEITRKLIEEYRLNSLIFSEDFNDLSSVDTTNTGKEGYKWYVARAYGAGVLTTDDYSVENGIMTLHTNKPTYNYGLDTYNCKTGTGFAYNKGYMEIRLRIPRSRRNEDGEKGVPAIWALSVDKLNNTADAWVEMDWMEYWGINGYDSNTPNGFYTVTLHDQHLTGTVVTTHFKNSNYKCEGLGDGQWHTMGWLWQDNLFVAYLDGVEVMRQVYSPTTDATPSPYTQKSDGTVDKIGVFSLLNTQYNPIIIGGSKDNPMELDYIRVWNNSHIPATAGVDSTEQAAREFVNAYGVDADGKAIKTVTKENADRVLAGESAWNALSDTAKAAVDTLLQTNGQPAFAQLLAQAKQLQEAQEQPTTMPSDGEATVPSTEATTTPMTDGTEATLPTDPTVPLDDVSPKSKPQTALIIAGGIVLVGGAAIVWVYWRKKKK